GVDLLRRHRTSVGPLEKIVDNPPSALRPMLSLRMPANENALVAVRRLRTRIERPDNLHVVNEQSPTHVRIDVLAWIGKIRQLREGRAEGPFARFESHPRRV